MASDLISFLVSLRPYAPLLVILFGPRLVNFSRSLRSSTPADPLSPVLLSLLALQVTYAVYALLFPPYDVFVTHDLHTLSSPRSLAEKLLRAAGLSTLPDPSEPLGALIEKLASTSGRQTYLRWGHDVATGCGWCATKSDYALAALPRILWPYARQAAIIGGMGWQWLAGPNAGRRAARYRLPAGGAVAAACAAEMGARWWMDLRVRNGQIFHLQAALHAARVLVLTLITALYVLLPVRTPPEIAVQEQLSAELERAAHTSRLSTSVRGAVVRDPRLLAAATRGEVAAAHAEDDAFRSEEVRKALEASGYSRSREQRRGARGWLEGVWTRAAALG